MHRISPLCSSNPVSQPPISLFPHQNPPFPLSRCKLYSGFVSTSMCFQSGLSLPLQNYKNTNFTLHCTAAQEITETNESTPGFVEIGYLSKVHGLQGEICVKPNTDFHELRLSKPGVRWLRQRVLGRETIQEMELVDGRSHPGQRSWILKFKGMDTVDQVRSLVGSTLLAKEEDRPELEDGEFYTRDLIGMRVILKDTGEAVGSVVNVFDSGASDLLHVMLDSSTDGNANSKSIEAGPLVWIPFVEAIVPDVDLNTKEIQITPPKGLLELNIRSDDKSKKERRQLEWKERKKFQKRLIAAKKKLCELEQQHVFHGFRFGEKSQKNSLAEQIVGVNSELLQQALKNIKDTSKSRWILTEQINMARTKLLKNTLKVSQESINPYASKDKLGNNINMQQKGQQLPTEGKVALCLVVNDKEELKQEDESNPDSEGIENSFSSLAQALLGDDQSFVKIEDRGSVPLVLVCPTRAVKSLQNLFLDNDYFSFDSEKVWFLEEEDLPVVSSSLNKQKKHPILMKSPWDILRSPVGSGGIISLFAAHDILENLSKIGADYIQICNSGGKYIGLSSLLLGFVDSREADIGFQISSNLEELEENINMVYSVNSMKKLTKQINKIQFYSTMKQHSYVDMVEEEWVNVDAASGNSIELRSSIYSCLNLCPADKICLIEITE